jgi:hypothetical protein
VKRPPSILSVWHSAWHNPQLHKRTKIQKKPEIPRGRIGTGVRPEDVDYLVDLYKKRELDHNLGLNGFTPLSNDNVFILARLADLPASKVHRALHNPRTAARLQRMLNKSQGDWKFTLQTIPNDHTEYKIEDIGILNVGDMGQEPSDNNDDDFDLTDVLDL